MGQKKDVKAMNKVTKEEVEKAWKKMGGEKYLTAHRELIDGLHAAFSAAVAAKDATPHEIEPERSIYLAVQEQLGATLDLVSILG